MATRGKPNLYAAAVTGALDGFTHDTFTAGGKTRDIYRIGTGPAVLVISEIPGITPRVADFARRVADIGCTAVLPRVFGDPGRPPDLPYTLRSVVPACISREFSAFAKGRTSPITTWLRALAAQVRDECGGPGVGVVGMCFTGGFALAMMVDDVVLAPVLSQPSLPIGLTKAHRRDLGISDEDLARVKERCESGICLLGLRFTGDSLSPAERFEHLRQELGDAFVAVEIGQEGHPVGVKHPHSVLTEHLVDEPGHPTRQALEMVLDLFRTKLLA